MTEPARSGYRGCNLSGRAMREFAAIAVVAALIVLPGAAFAQGGSVGGDVGHRDKSASGGGERPAPRGIAPKPHHTAVNHAVHSRETGTQCRNIVGSWTWRWLNNQATTTFKPDGTVGASNGDFGTWTCANGDYTINWQRAGVANQMTLSPDARHLSGSGAGILVDGFRQ